MHSPKRKFKGVINFKKPLEGIGSQVTYMADDITQLMSYSKMYSNKDFTMYIYENKKEYPDFDWQLVKEIDNDKGRI